MLSRLKPTWPRSLSLFFASSLLSRRFLSRYIYSLNALNRLIVLKSIRFWTPKKKKWLQRLQHSSLFCDSRCTPNKAYNSRWGCHSGSKTTLNVIVTDQRNNIIYPRTEYLKDLSTLWYAMPGVDESYSKELVFTNFGVPFYLEKHRELRIWCGEDLKNKNDGDNQGRVCVDVYIKYYWLRPIHPEVLFFRRSYFGWSHNVSRWIMVKL